PPSPVLFGPSPAPFARLTQTPPVESRLSQTGVDSRALLSAGLALLVVGAACLGLAHLRRPRPTPAATDDFPALTFEPTVRAVDALPYGRGRAVGQRVRALLGSPSPFARTS